MIKTDILIVGSGCSGLYCALQCPKDKNILLISKSDLESSDSYLAQGGICMLKDDTDYESYFEDTMKAGHYENDKESVGIMIRSSQDVIRDLVSYGAEFEQALRRKVPTPTSASCSTTTSPAGRSPANCWPRSRPCRTSPSWSTRPWSTSSRRTMSATAPF